MLEIETLCKMRHIKWGGCCERRGIHGKCQIAKCKKIAKPKKFQIYANRNMQNANAEGEEEG